MHNFNFIIYMYNFNLFPELQAGTLHPYHEILWARKDFSTDKDKRSRQKKGWQDDSEEWTDLIENGSYPGVC